MKELFDAAINPNLPASGSARNAHCSLDSTLRISFDSGEFLFSYAFCSYLRALYGFPVAEKRWRR